jgi:aldehyde dehydrogenase (NAD+)
MLIDGKLVESGAGATFENVNPATEDVHGQVADGIRGDMQRSVKAARRAVDTTDWSIVDTGESSSAQEIERHP